VSESSRIARASGRGRRKTSRQTTDAATDVALVMPIGLDKTVNRTVFYAAMATKKQGAGGASRRGSHWIADAGGCEVRWFWAHHVGLEPTGGNFYMDFGTLGHTAMAYFYAEKLERKSQWLVDYPDVQESLRRDAKGHPEWLRTVQQLMEFYRRYEAGDPWTPLYIEEEFEATVGQLDPLGLNEPAEDFEYDGPCTDEACTNIVDGQHIAHRVKKVWHFPSLNDEVVTCRPDLIVQRNGYNWVIDHKFQGGGRKDRDRLPVIDDRYPDYQYTWQAMVNLHIVRQTLPIQGFIFNRVKRDSPFDVSRDLFSIRSRQYAKVPATIRATIARSRALRKKALAAPGTLIAHPWECKTSWECPFVRVCHTDTVAERDSIITSEFATKG